MMARHQPGGRRSIMEWSVRCGLALAALAIGSASVTRTIGTILRARDPAQAYSLAPGDGRIAALYAASLMGTGADPGSRRHAVALARLALAHEPTAVPALTVLSIDAARRNDSATTARLFHYAGTLSRRDLPTQLLMIEDSVTRGDVTSALRHYDIALRTSESAADILFPVLAAAISGPGIRDALVRQMTTRPIWSDSFINYVGSKGPDPAAAAQLFEGLHHTGIGVSEEATTAVINRLLTHGSINEAWSYYVSVRGNVPRNRSRDPRFGAGFSLPSLFDWVPASDGGVVASIQRDKDAGLLNLSASQGVGGPLVEQAQVLPRGEYRLIGHSVGINQADGAQPYWVLVCRADSRELGRVTVTNSDLDRGRFDGDFVVPGDCAAQTLRLIARPSDKIEGLSGQIDLVQLAPAR